MEFINVLPVAAGVLLVATIMMMTREKVGAATALLALSVACDAAAYVGGAA